MKFKIEYRKKKMKEGFIGLNYYAAKAHHIPFRHKHRAVLEIFKTSKPIMHDTEKHEEIEYNLMKHGMHYHPAHDIALRYEDKKGSLKKIMKKIKERNHLK